MLKDTEGHLVRIARDGNGHAVILGKTGQGKTFCVDRMVEEYVKMGKKILIVDFSGSYTRKELIEKDFAYMDKVEFFDLPNSFLQWRLRVSDVDVFRRDIKDSIVETLGCSSYYQDKLLEEAIEYLVEKDLKVSIPGIMMALERMLAEEKEGEKAVGNEDNLNRLLTRLKPYKNITSFEITRMGTEDPNGMPVTVIDLTDFPERQRKFLTELLVSLFWREIFRQEFSNRCDVLILDEIQFMSLKDGAPLPELLRQGRKRKVDVVLSTQFITHYTRGEIRALQQADNFMIFRPTPADYRLLAEIIEPENPKMWEKQLSRLKRGVAVLKGFYRLDDRNKVLSEPLLVKVEAERIIQNKDLGGGNQNVRRISGCGGCVHACRNVADQPKSGI